MAPVLTLVSPISGPPGTAITLTGTGFAAGSQVGCPALVPTVYVGPTSLTAVIALDLMGAAGASLGISVFVQNTDGSLSAALPFTVLFPSDHQQTWTTIAAVVAEVPGFKRGGRITDATILIWMRTVAQSIAGSMLRRGLPLDPTQWQQAAAGTLAPAPWGVLDLINRLGAAARLAAAVAGEFGTGEWALGKNLMGEYLRESAALANGGYDKLFKPSAATIDSSPQLVVGDITNSDGSGNPDQAFQKDQVF